MTNKYDLQLLAVNDKHAIKKLAQIWADYMLTKANKEVFILDEDEDLIDIFTRVNFFDSGLRTRDKNWAVISKYLEDAKAHMRASARVANLYLT
jgi:hypothetical protein